MPEDRSKWTQAIYACETCGNRYTTHVYAGMAAGVLGSGKRLGSAGQMVPTLATTCVADGGRFRLVAS